MDAPTPLFEYSNSVNWFNRSPHVINEDGYTKSGITADTIKPNTLHKLKINDEPLLLTQLEDGDIIAFTPFCPHAAADLTQGDLHRGRITCPEHDWKFDLKTGCVLYPADESCRLKRFPVQLIDGEIWIKIEQKDRGER